MATSSGSSASSGNSTSNSTPSLLQSPQSNFSLNLSNLLEQMGQQQAQWASGQFAKTSAITDQNINSYLQQSNQGAGLAGGLLKDYNQLFAPMQDQYARNAGSYASQGRLNTEMGRAESDSMQAGQKAKANAEQELQSFGIDPSSGRYQDLVRASDTQNAAAAAGAGEQARVTTENQQQQRLLNSIQMGQQLPGAAVNAMNSAYQGIAGAENSALSNATVGTNMMTSPNQFMATAQQVKLPPVGNTSQSQSTQSAGSSNSSSSPNSGGSGDGSGGSSGGGTEGFNTSTHGGGGGGYNPMGSVPGDGSDGGSGGGSGGGRSSGGVNPDAAITNLDQPYYSTDPNAYDPSGGDTGGYDPSGGGDTGGYDPSYDTSSSYDPGSDGSASSSDAYFAQGGVIRGQSGGMVPPSMSPSRGARVDDVPAHISQTGGQAHINVGEFVIPRDVVQYKGHEFFSKLIAQSRKARMGGGATPQRGQYGHP